MQHTQTFPEDLTFVYDRGLLVFPFIESSVVIALHVFGLFLVFKF